MLVFYIRIYEGVIYEGVTGKGMIAETKGREGRRRVWVWGRERNGD
jgi:hypothetical protein